MDIDIIRTLVKANEYYTTREFNKRMDQREFNLEMAKQVVNNGEIIETRTRHRKKGPYPECTIRYLVNRKVAGITIPDYLHITCAVGNKVAFITGVWESMMTKDKKRTRR